MKYLKIATVFLACLTLLTPNIFPGDTKYYSEYALKYKVNNLFDLFFTPEFRLKRNMRTLYYYHMRGGVTFHAHQYLDLSGAYRFIQNKDSKGHWGDSDIHYYEMIATPKAKLCGFDLSDANKFEYRVYENARDRWAYRNLSTIGYPAKIKNFEFAPYVSDEVYYDFEIGKWNLNWATMGVTKKIAKNIALGLYFRFETARTGKTDKWTTNRIIGSNLSLSF